MCRGDGTGGETERRVCVSGGVGMCGCVGGIKMGVSPTNPKQQAAIPFFGHTEILHMLVSMGSTALALRVWD